MSSSSPFSSCLFCYIRSSTKEARSIAVCSLLGRGRNVGRLAGCFRQAAPRSSALLFLPFILISPSRPPPSHSRTRTSVCISLGALAFPPAPRASFLQTDRASVLARSARVRPSPVAVHPSAVPLFCCRSDFAVGRPLRHRPSD